MTDPSYDHWIITYRLYTVNYIQMSIVSTKTTANQFLL